MTLNLLTIALFVLAAVPFAFLPMRWRTWYVLVGSLIAVYALQPALPIRFSDFILPTAAISLSVAVWWWTRAAGQAFTPEDRTTLIVTALVVVGMAAFRFVDADYRLTPSRPPEPVWVALALLIVAGVVGVSSRVLSSKAQLMLGFALSVALFVVLKAAPIAAAVSGVWRGLTEQDVSLASALDLNWLGFSYLAFRWIHLLRDRQTSLLPEISLRQALTFLLFAPAYTAGPIARVEQMNLTPDPSPDSGRDSIDPHPASPASEGGVGTDDAPISSPFTGRDRKGFRIPPPAGEVLAIATFRFPLRLRGGLGWGSEPLLRIASGLFKKFVIADTLAAGMALTPTLAAQTDSPLLMWVLLYGYALRLYFDFSGYSDIAIGLGKLFGYNLPENFNAPYLKSDLTSFWKSWHISLSDWARFYVFTPLSRQLLRWKLRGGWWATLGQPSNAVLIAHLATMLTIGLWHGVTVNFVVWGVWHGLGLYAHKRWTDRTRSWQRGLAERPNAYRAYTVLAWFITLQYVVLGWVWFALPEASAALHVLRVLIGGGA